MPTAARSDTPLPRLLQFSGQDSARHCKGERGVAHDGRRWTTGLPRTQQSRRARRDDCIARMIRKQNRARLTAHIALLLSSGMRLLSPRFQSRRRSRRYDRIRVSWRRASGHGFADSPVAPITARDAIALPISDRGSAGVAMARRSATAIGPIRPRAAPSFLRHEHARRFRAGRRAPRHRNKSTGTSRRRAAPWIASRLRASSRRRRQ